MILICLSDLGNILACYGLIGLFTLRPLFKNRIHVYPTNWLGVYTVIKIVYIIKV